jgi:hypothetical protein
MATIKMTFTLDESAVRCLEDASARLALPKSEIVREAICEFHERIGRLSERERTRMLGILDELAPLVPQRRVAQVEREITAIRKARRNGGHGTTLRGRV